MELGGIEQKISILKSIDGVNVKSATAYLAVFNPKKYCVFDGTVSKRSIENVFFYAPTPLRAKCYSVLRLLGLFSRDNYFIKNGED